MDSLNLFRFIFAISSAVGFILCFVSLVVPYWIQISTAAVTGHQGLFVFCIENHESDKACSEIMDSNVGAHYKVCQVFMCFGFVLYVIFVTLAVIVLFWTRSVRKIRAMKFGASATGILSAICLIVTVTVFESNLQNGSETLSYGWYLAVISLIFPALASPCYAVDGYTTKLKKNADITKTPNIAPRPTAITEYERQQMIQGFKHQMRQKNSGLPQPLGLRGKLNPLYDDCKGEHPPPRPVTPGGSDIDEDVDIHVSKVPMVPPEYVEYKYDSMYDEGFVHPPPHIVSTELSVGDIFRKKLNGGYESDSSAMSRYSLESGQLDDNDLEIYLITSGSKTGDVSKHDHPHSHEAFKKRPKMKHKVTPKTIDGKNVTKIEHEGLPTIKIVGPDLESHNYIEPANKMYAPELLPKEEDVVLPSEAESEKEERVVRRKRKSSANSRKKISIFYENEAMSKSDNEIYKERYGASSPYMRETNDDDEHQKRKRKSSKKKKRGRSKSDVGKPENVAASEKSGKGSDDEEKQIDDKVPVDFSDIFTSVHDKANRNEQKYTNLNVSELNKTNHTTTTDNQTVPTANGKLDQAKKPDKSDEDIPRRRSSKRKKHKRDRSVGKEDDEMARVQSKRSSSRKKRTKHKPYFGEDCEYDRVSAEKNMVVDSSGIKNVAEEPVPKEVSFEKKNVNVNESIEEILKIPVQQKDAETDTK